MSTPRILNIVDNTQRVVRDVFNDKASLLSATKAVGFYKVIIDETQGNKPTEYHWNGTELKSLGGAGGHVIKDETITYPKRESIKLVGATVTDNASQNETVIEIIGGAGTAEITQITRIDRTAGQEEEFNVAGGSKKVIDAYKMDNTGMDTVTVHRDFDNADAGDFAFDADYVEFIGVAKLKADYEVEASNVQDLGDGKKVYEFVLDASKFKDIVDILGY